MVRSPTKAPKLCPRDIRESFPFGETRKNKTCCETTHKKDLTKQNDTLKAHDLWPNAPLDFSFLEHLAIDPEIPSSTVEFKLSPTCPSPLCPKVLPWVCASKRKAQLHHVGVKSWLWKPFPALTCSVCLGKKWTKMSVVRSFLLAAISDLRISYIRGCIQTSMFSLSSTDLSTVHPYLPQTFWQWVLIAP